MSRDASGVSRDALGVLRTQSASPGTSPRTTDPPRRLNRQARRDQLVAAATPLLARHGPMDLSLDEVAERVGVTRNLLYHYFPGGRADLVTAVVQEAERQLLGPWAPDHPSGPPPDESALSRLLDHALAPTHVWRIHRLARAIGTRGVSEVVERSTREVVRMLAAVHLASEKPSASTELALRGFVAYAETILDGARAAGLARSEIRRLLAQMLRAVVTAQ